MIFKFKKNKKDTEIYNYSDLMKKIKTRHQIELDELHYKHKLELEELSYKHEVQLQKLRQFHEIEKMEARHKED